MVLSHIFSTEIGHDLTEVFLERVDDKTKDSDAIEVVGGWKRRVRLRLRN